MADDPALPIAMAFIQRWESFRSEPYWDEFGEVYTYGWGFITLSDGSPVQADTPPISLADANERLAARVEATIIKVRNLIKRPISNNAVAALTSFAWNEGDAQLRRSAIVLLYNYGEPADAAAYFRNYVYARGKRIQGLVNRRAAEAELFLTPDDTEIIEADESADDLNAAELNNLNQQPPEAV